MILEIKNIIIYCILIIYYVLHAYRSRATADVNH